MADSENTKVKALTQLARYFHHDLNPEELNIILSSLEPWSTEQVMVALRLGVRKWRFFPRVPDMLDLLEGKEEANMKLDAATEFSKILERIAKDNGGQFRFVEGSY